MKKVLLLGSTGMLGHQVYFRLKNDSSINLKDLSYRNKLHEDTIICNITDSARLSGIIQEFKPDYLINCIGILIKGSQENPKIRYSLIHIFLTGWYLRQINMEDK
ncbi:NAD-dependent epimerase/dehydratase family protein [Algoriphagus halophilus]|uniref:NAD-dependent epimerase/dehydratase family protein n=1 Tax=Algoriphagus halophilus TaxID=226505 RepID=UPI00358E5996